MSDIQTKLDAAIENAIKQSDTRFYATQGRRMVFPGLEDSDKELIELCGYQFLEGTGDVLKSESDKKMRTQQIEFAQMFNLKMKELCLSSSR